mmetsp:Transcript_7397/g.13721  ORF Transcript_7397/g.13721 Transcript_7397/m.13721 type:complete len:976 (+) Transcript_7397:128-3055(+)
MAQAVAGAAAAAVGAKAVFEYNRKNFHEDREMRMKKEFQEMAFRVDQGKLWRQDVRDIVSLVEKKTKAYLQVCVFMLGFTVSLWCQGRLPENTPAWLMLGNQVGIGGSFTFLLLTVWLATHASVAAKAYESRLLTQMVRLPMPTWEELEACRTYGSSFEQVEAKQMFRVPFLMGKQESLVKTAGPEAADYGGTGSSSGSAAAQPQASTDPWGLERRGDDTYELGQHYGADVGKLRHIKLVRQAAMYWQNYDAFARISMSIGVNQLMLAMSYFILGYVLIHIRAPFAAFGGVFILMGSAVAIANLDMSLPKEKQFVILGLLIAGPTLSCLATYHWGQTSELGEQIGRVLAPGAFFSHGLLVMLLTYFCRIRETTTGGMMPTAFRISLYLDIFGWLKEDFEEEEEEVTDGRLTRLMSTGSVASVGEMSRQTSPVLSETATTAPSPEAVQESAIEKDKVGYYAMDYMDSPSDEEPQDAESAVRRRARPALSSVAYDPASGLPIPTRPGDAAPPGTVEDLRKVPGAPRENWNPALDSKEPTRDFFRPTTFFPAKEDKASRQQMLDQLKFMETGHDRDRPGILPWKVFRSATILLGAVWMLAALYSFLDAVVLDVLFESLAISSSVNFGPGLATLQIPGRRRIFHNRMEPVVPKHTLFELLKAGFARVPPVEPERVDMIWPHSGRPQGLSCDAAGHHFVMTDGVSTMFAEVALGQAMQPPKSAEELAVNGQHLRASKPGTIPPTMDFKLMSRCSALQGQALLDTAITCPDNAGNASQPSACEVLVLHQNGGRVVACEMSGSGSTPGRGTAAHLSQAWLQDPDIEQNEAERVSWLLVDSKCTHRHRDEALDCASVGTTHGRVAHLRNDASRELAAGDVLFPDDVLPESSQSDQPAPKRETQPGVVRAFSSRYLGALQRHRQSIHVLDKENNLAQVGSLILPIKTPVTSFCAGGGYVYLLTRGAEPEMWRLPLPKRLAAGRH